MKTKGAIKHDIIRAKQANNDKSLHHPDEKINQVQTCLDGQSNLKIAELFCGQGNLTAVYKKFGSVEEYDMKYKKTGDSFLLFHKFIYEKKKYNVIDLDPYGFPTRFFPDIFLLIDKGVLFVTVPKPYCNVLHAITRTHLISYYGQFNPKEKDVIERIVLWGLCHWRKVQCVSSLDLKSVWRMAFTVERIKSTEYTGVKNRK